VICRQNAKSEATTGIEPVHQSARLSDMISLQIKEVSDV
jgi:hypothetical protein